MAKLEVQASSQAKDVRAYKSALQNNIPGAFYVYCINLYTYTHTAASSITSIVRKICNTFFNDIIFSFAG